MVVSRKRYPSAPVSLMLSGTDMEKVDCFKYLGLLLSSSKCKVCQLSHDYEMYLLHDFCPVGLLVLYLSMNIEFYLCIFESIVIGHCQLLVGP